LLFAAVGVVVQLKDALNAVWEVKSESGGGVWKFFRTYLVSLAGVLGVGFLLLVSMLMSTAVATVGKYATSDLPEFGVQTIEFFTSFLVMTCLFSMMFKWLPDTEIAWRDVWVGAALTALLFDVGKLAIGLYIGKQGLESTFGAAASLVVVLIWVYYSAQIILMGAEFTHVYALRVGSLKGKSTGMMGDTSGGRLTNISDAFARAPFVTVLGALCLGLYMGFGRHLVAAGPPEPR
jgi:membrane protein